MRIARRAAALGVVIFAFALLPASAAWADSCGFKDIYSAGCPEATGNIGDDSVDINATVDKGGSSNDRSGKTGGDGKTNGPGVTIPRPDYPENDPNAVCPRQDSGGCTGWGLDRVTPPPETEPPEDTPPITLVDIASFTPEVGASHMEPDGWIVIGLHTNFYSTGGVSVIEGELLDRDAAVRFTPVAWHWSFGDGTGIDSASPGASWQQLGLAEFEATSTSHIFTETGAVSIVLTIDYSAEYTFNGSAWTPIAGVLPVQTTPLTALAGDAQTVLVARDCGQNPRGPGC